MRIEKSAQIESLAARGGSMGTGVEIPSTGRRKGVVFHQEITNFPGTGGERRVANRRSSKRKSRRQGGVDRPQGGGERRQREAGYPEETELRQMRKKKNVLGTTISHRDGEAAVSEVVAGSTGSGRRPVLCREASGLYGNAKKTPEGPVQLGTPCGLKNRDKLVKRGERGHENQYIETRNGQKSHIRLCSLGPNSMAVRIGNVQHMAGS